MRRHAVNQKQASNLQTLFSSHSNISGSWHRYHSPFPLGIFFSHLDLPRAVLHIPIATINPPPCTKHKFAQESRSQFLPCVIYLIVIAVISSSCVTLPFDIKAIPLRIFLYCHDARVCFTVRAGWLSIVWCGFAVDAGCGGEQVLSNLSMHVSVFVAIACQ